MINTPHKQYCQCEQNNGEALLKNYTLELTLTKFRMKSLMIHQSVALDSGDPFSARKQQQLVLDRSSQYQHHSYIQGGPKKLHTELVAITLSILNGFSKFFHCWKAK